MSLKSPTFLNLTTEKYDCIGWIIIIVEVIVAIEFVYIFFFFKMKLFLLSSVLDRIQNMKESIMSLVVGRMNFSRYAKSCKWPGILNMGRHDFSPQDVFGNIIGLVCRTVTIFLLAQSARLSGSPRYFEHCRKAYRKFSRGIRKKFHLKIWGFVRIF